MHIPESMMTFTFHNVSIKSIRLIAAWTFSSSLHSTMSLLNPMPRLPFIANSVFTFHNVSIKSRFSSLFKTNDFTFTFHDVSIKSIERYERNARRIPLHSTMFLLNQRTSTRTWITNIPLHSTMFLLNHVRDWYVGFSVLTLHSTMFLLNPWLKKLRVIY